MTEAHSTMTINSSNNQRKEESCDLRTAKETFKFSQAECRPKEIWKIHEILQNRYFIREPFTNYFSNFRRNEIKHKNFLIGLFHEFSALSETFFKFSAESNLNRSLFSQMKSYVQKVSFETDILNLEY